MSKKEALNILKSKFTDVSKSASIKKIRETYKIVKNQPGQDNEAISVNLERLINSL